MKKPIPTLYNLLCCAMITFQARALSIGCNWSSCPSASLTFYGLKAITQLTPPAFITLRMANSCVTLIKPEFCHQLSCQFQIQQQSQMLNAISLTRLHSLENT